MFFPTEAWNFKCIAHSIGTVAAIKKDCLLALPELVEAGDLLRRDGPGLLVVLLRELEAILV